MHSILLAMRLLLSRLAILCLCGFAFQLGHAQSTKLQGFQLPAGSHYLPGKLICKIKPEYRTACSDEAIELPAILDTWQAIGMISVSKIFPNIEPPIKETDRFGQAMVDLSLLYIVSFDSTKEITATIHTLGGRPEVEYCEPWYVADLFYQPNDPFADTSGTNNGQWGLTKMHVREAWDYSKGEEGTVVIGVIDTGTSFQHVDLQDNIAHNSDDPIDGLDNDADGYIDNYQGWDMGGATFGGPGDNDPSFVNSAHGVGVTGTLGATADNGIGLAGTCFNCGYLPVKGTADNVGGISHGYQGVVYAVEQGAQIVNCSWGSITRSKFGEDVVNYAAINKGAAVIVACGNSGNERTYYPAGYDRAFSVANSYVGEDTLHTSSTYDYTVDIAAPGFSITSTKQHSGYLSWQGTSVAAPMAAGIVGLALTHFPTLSGFQAAHRVRVTADDHYAANFTTIGKAGTGRVNALRALTDALRPSIRQQSYSVINTRGTTELHPGDTIEIRGDYLNYLHPATDLSIQISSNDSTASWVQVIEGNLNIGPLAMNQSFSVQASPFRFVLDAATPIDQEVGFRLSYTDIATGYSDFEYIEFRVNRSYLDITANALHTTVTSNGNFGFNDFGPKEQGLGIAYNGFENILFEGGFMIGKSPFEVSDNIRTPSQPNEATVQDDDYFAADIVHRISSPLATFAAIGRFTDAQAEIPMSISITQQAYAFDEVGHENYVILTYQVKNNGTIPLNNLYAGLLADWDIAIISDTDIRDACNYDLTEKMGFAYGLAGGNGNYYGISLLSDETFKSFATTGTGSFVFDDPGKYLALSNSPSLGSASAGISTGGEDILQSVSGGPFTINPNEERMLAFAVMGGSIYQGLVNANTSAREKYRCVILGEGPTAGFTLSDTLIAPGAQVQFSDQNINLLSSQWEFGDGQSASGTTASHAFSQPGVYTISLYSSDGDCEVRSQATLTVDNSVSIGSEFTSEAFSVSPNPTTGSFEVSWSSDVRGPYEIWLTNLAGQRIWESSILKQHQNESESFSIPNLAPGIYLLTLQHESIWMHQKLQILK